MKPVSPGALLANRVDQRASSHSRVELRVQLERHRQAERRARDVLKDTIIAAGMPAYTGTAILAAADSLRKAAVVAALAEHAEPEPPGSNA